jgi:DNA-binding NarL/FixJ family response regulator
MDVLVVGSLGSGSRLCSSLRAARIAARLAPEAEEAARQALPGSVVLMEAGASPAAGRVRALLAVNPGLRIIVLANGDPGQDLIDALLVGAAGYLPDHLDPEALARSVRGVAEGEVALPRTWMGRVITALRQSHDEGRRGPALVRG